MLRALWLLLIVPFLACSHQDKPEGPNAMRKAAEEFMQRVRWKDFAGAAEMLVPARREHFVSDRRKAHDERDLSILDYDLEELKMAPDAMSGQIDASISYSKLPSVSVKNDDISLFFVFRDGHWFVDRMVGGPFPELH